MLAYGQIPPINASLSRDIPAAKSVANAVAMDGLTVLPTATNVVFNSTYTLTNSQFYAPISFALAHFKDKVTLSEVSFEDNFNFNWVVFSGPVSFYQVYAKALGQFFFTQFKGNTNFNKLHCLQSCNFMHDHFDHARFSHSDFSSTLSFKYSVANSLAFRSCQFDKNVDMSETTLLNLQFHNSFLLGGINLSNADLRGKVAFDDTELFDYINLSNATIGKEIVDLSTLKITDPNNKIRINLLGTDSAKVKFNYQYFNLYFPKNTSAVEIDKLYKELLKSFKKNGDTISNKLMLAEYQHYLYMRDKNYIFDIISKSWWNYSTNPEWIFYWIVVLIIFYATINTLFYDQLSSDYFDVPFLASSTRPYTIKMNFILRFIHAFPRALLFTFLMFFGTQFRMRNGLREFKSNNIFVNLYFITIITTGMLCMFFLFHYLFAQIYV